MRVDVGDIVRARSGLLEGREYSPGRPETLGVWGGDVVGIAGNSAAS